MAVRELEIGAPHGLYARYFQPLSGRHPAANLFSTLNHARIAGATDLLRQLRDLELAGYLHREASTGDLLVALSGHLVYPDPAPEGGAPLVLMAHGMSTAFRPSIRKPVNEVRSFRGYRYLQRWLAEREVASFSVNLNLVNEFSGIHDIEVDFDLRAQTMLLHAILLDRLSGSTRPIGVPFPIVVHTPIGLRPLPEVLAADRLDTATRSAIRSAAASLNGRLRVDHMGLFGHSRGANAVCNIVRLFETMSTRSRVSASTGGRPAPEPAASGGLTASLQRLARLLPSHSPSLIKAVVPLQPPNESSPITSSETFLVAVGSSHDEDANNESISIYDPHHCPKAMVFVHGATHNRFNTVWRTLPENKRAINLTIACQAPARIMSNATHESVGVHFIGSVFVARLRDRPRLLLLYTGEGRAPVRVDVSRAWRWSFPLGRTPGTLLLDERRLEQRAVSAPSGARAAAAVATAVTSAVWTRSQDYTVFVQSLTAFRVARPSHEVVEVRIPVDASDRLEIFTHFSFRVAKEIDPRSARARRIEPLRNFAVELITEGPPLTRLTIGNVIDGNAIRSIIHPVYPTRKFNLRDQERPRVCLEQSAVIFQTVELPLQQIIGGSRHTIADLARVRAILVHLKRARNKTGPDIFWLKDFELTQRDLPPP